MGWTVTGLGMGSEHPFIARLRRCSIHPSGSLRRTRSCDGKHEGDIATFVRKLRKTYQPAEGLFR
jgi:hypothetical protein